MASLVCSRLNCVHYLHLPVAKKQNDIDPYMDNQYYHDADRLFHQLFHNCNNNTLTTFCQNCVFILGSADRNGPFRGFALVTTGMIIRQYIHYIKHEYAIGIICIVTSWLLFCYSLPFYLIFLGGGLFIIIGSIQIKDCPIYATLRIHSIFIYFIHMYFAVFVHSIFKTFFTNSTYAYIIWLIIFFISLIVSILFNWLRKITTFRWLNHLIS